MLQPAGAEPLRRPGGEPDDTAVGDHHALGPAGGPRGVDDVGGVVRQQRPEPVGVGQVGVVGALEAGAVLQDQRGTALGQRGRRLPGGDDERGPGVLQHQPDALGRVARVHREVRRARLQHRPERRRQFGGARQAERDQALRAGAAGDQQPGKAVGAPVHLRVVQPRRAADDGGPVGGPGHLRLEQLGQRAAGPVRPTRHGRVPGIEKCALLLLGEHGQFGQPALRTVRHPFQQAVQVTGDPGHGPRLEQVRVVLDRQRAAAPGLRRELQDQVEAGGRAGQRMVLEPQAAGRRQDGGGGLLDDERLHQRGTARVPGRGQLLHHPVERDPGVREGVQHGRTHALDEPVDGGRLVHVAAQHHGVGEEAGHLLQLPAVPPGGDGPERHVPLAGVAREQQRGRPCEQGEHRRAAACGEVPQPGHQVRREPVPVRGAGGGAQRGPGPVGGQLQLLQPGQAALPVPEVLGLPGGRPPLLPHREVGVLEGRGGQAVRLAGDLRVVERGQLAGEDAHRPAVGDDVVLPQQQQVLPVGEPDQQRSGERTVRQVVGAAQLLGQQLLDGLGPPLGGQASEICRAQRQGGLRRDPLHALPVDRAERGAQRVVAGDEPPQGPAQRLGVRCAEQPQGHAGVVLPRAGGEVVEEPQPSLGAGQWQRHLARGGRDRLRRSGGGLGAQQLGQGGDGARGEDVPQGEPHAQLLPDPGQGPGREDRVTAQLEEVLARPDRLDAQDLRPDGGQGALLPGERCRRAGRGRPDGRGQRPPVDLVLRGERQCRQHDDHGRHQVGRQGGGQGRAQRRRVRGPLRVGGGDVADQALAAGLVLADHDDGLADGAVPQQGGLDLPRFDPEAPELHLPVETPEELHLPVGGPARPVTGAVEPGAGRSEGVGDEACGGQARAVQVAARHRVATDVQLSVGTGRLGTHRRIEDVHPGVRQCAADRRCAGPGRQRPGPGGDDGGLGGSVGVDHAAAGRPAIDQSGRAGFGPDDQRAQVAGGTFAAGRGGEGGQGGRRDQGVRDAVFVQDGGEFLAQPGAVRGHHEGGAGQHGDEEFQHGGVEAGRGELQHPVTGPHRVALGGGGGEPADAAVGDRHALRRPGGARGVDHVRGVVGADRRSGEVGLAPVGLAPVGLALIRFAHVRRVQHGADEGRVVEGRRGRRVGEHQRPPLGGIGGVNGQEGGARARDGQLRRDQLHRARQNQRHRPLRPGTASQEVAGQQVGPSRQFPVGPGAPAIGHRRRVRGTGHPRGEQLTERRVPRCRGHAALLRPSGAGGLRRVGRGCGLVGHE